MENILLFPSIVETIDPRDFSGFMHESPKIINLHDSSWEEC